MIALVTKFDWALHQMDVKSTFLNGNLKEEIYLVQPKGFVKQGKEHFVCKLKKALYGLEHAPRSWYEKIDKLFFQQGYIKSKNDPNLYINNDEHGNVVLISLYVGDLIIIGSSIVLIDAIKETLSQAFEMKDLGEIHYCLGIEAWSQTSRTLITQSKHAMKLIQMFNMQDFEAICIPLKNYFK